MHQTDAGKRLKDARVAKGLTQKQLAALLGCSNTTISKYEQGEIENMPRPRMKRMADILEVPPVVLFDFATQKYEADEKKPDDQKATGLRDTGYSELTDENKKVVDSLIATLLKSQSNG